MDALKGALTKGYRGLRAFLKEGGLRKSEEDGLARCVESGVEEREERGEQNVL
jgi:hypothetical protein